MSVVSCHLSSVSFHLSTFTCHLTCHLTTTLFSFSGYESPRVLSDAAEGGLVINNKTKTKKIKNYAKNQFLLQEFKEEPLI